ncbi:MAG: hypothetical protein JKY37_28575 [Nannocystaceae bacterium]|nr:hypothetical protein [Nannocystaceae bacterium]
MTASRSILRFLPIACVVSALWLLPIVGNAASPPDAATTAAPTNTASPPAAVAPPADEPSPSPSPTPATGWGDGFGGDEDEEDDEDEDEDEDDGLGADVPDDDAAHDQSAPSQLVTVPGGKVLLEPPVSVGPSGNPRHKWVYKTLLAMRYNPLGATIDFKTGHRVQLFDKDSVLFRDSYLLSGVRVFATPAYTRLGPHLEFQPFALLNLYAGYNFVGYYGNFDLILSFPSATSDYSETALDARGEAGDNYPVTGQIADISALLQVKIGPIALRNNVVFYWSNMNLRDGDRVWYDQLTDLAFPKRGWALTNDTDAIYLFPNSGLKLAARYSISHAFYDGDDYLPGEPTGKFNGPHHRLGPGVLYTFFDRPSQRFNKPTFILLSQWFLQHRYRTGQDISQAIPQITLALSFQGDLLPHPQRRRVPRKDGRRKAPEAKPDANEDGES